MSDSRQAVQTNRQQEPRPRPRSIVVVKIRPSVKTLRPRAPDAGWYHRQPYVPRGLGEGQRAPIVQRALARSSPDVAG